MFSLQNAEGTFKSVFEESNLQPVIGRAEVFLQGQCLRLQVYDLPKNKSFLSGSDFRKKKNKVSEWFSSSFLWQPLDREGETWKGKMEFLERRGIQYYFPLVRLWDHVSQPHTLIPFYDSLWQFIVFKTTVNPFLSAYVKYTYYVYSWKFFLTDHAHRMDAVFVSSLLW